MNARYIQVDTFTPEETTAPMTLSVDHIVGFYDTPEGGIIMTQVRPFIVTQTSDEIRSLILGDSINHPYG